MRLVFWLLLFCLWSGEMVGMELAKSFPIDSTSNFILEIVKIEPTCKSDSIRFYIKAMGIVAAPLNFEVAFITNGPKSPVSSRKDGENYILSTFLPKSGNIFITATDVQGITSTLSRSVSSIPKYQEPKSILTSIFNSSESKSTGIINGFFSDGSSPYKITLLNNSKTEEVVLTAERKFSFDSLSSGTYKIKITDACNNSDSSTVTVKADCKLAFKSKPKGSFDCKTNGKIEWILTDEPTTSIQAYAILQGSTQPRIDIESNGKDTEFEKGGLNAGAYQVVIQGGMCNFFDTTIVLSAPDRPVITDKKQEDINCSNENIGKITLTVSGGKSPYTYKWRDNPAINQPNRTNLPKGGYRVTVIDQAECSTTDTFTITQIPKPVLSANQTEIKLNCARDKNGEVTLMVNPTRTYTYIWSDGKTGQTRRDLAEGKYSVKAIDGQPAACESNEITITVTEPARLTLELESKDPTCPSNNNGTITAKVGGGTAPYTYAWIGGKTTQTITSLVAGSYTVTVRDKNGCELVSDSKKLEAQNGPIIPDPRIQNIICSSENIGSIDITVSGALSYSWTNAQSKVVATTEDLTDVAEGEYTVIVTDANKCTTTKSFEITRTSPPKNITYMNGNVSCKGSKDGKIEFSLKVGEPAVAFQWYNGDTQNKAISNLGAGEYGLTITNVENKCTTAQLLKVGEPPEALKSNGIKILTRSTCNDKEDGSIEVNHSGGWSGGYTYQWFKDGILLPDKVNKIKASSGKYKVIIQDSKFCMVMDEVDLNVEGNLFYNLYPTKETYSSTISPNLLKEAWDDPELTLPLAPNSDFTLFGTKEKIDTLWLLDEFAGVVLSTKKVGKNLPNDAASLIIVYGADLVDRAYKLWNRKQASSISPITVQPKPDIGGRIWILEWKNAGFFNELDEFGSANSAINFQLWIYEKTKNLELKFGTSTPNALPNPSLLFNGKSGPMIALVKGYNFQTDTYKDLWYLRGAANNPTPQVLRNGKLQEFNETLDSHPVSNQVYRFCAVAPVRFAPDPIPEIEIKATPNPTYERTTVKFSPLLQPTQVWVSDQLGRKVSPLQELIVGTTETELNLQGLPPGIYLIHLNNDQRTQVHKVIKQ